MELTEQHGGYEARRERHEIVFRILSTLRTISNSDGASTSNITLDARVSWSQLKAYGTMLQKEGLVELRGAKQVITPNGLKLLNKAESLEASYEGIELETRKAALIYGPFLRQNGSVLKARPGLILAIAIISELGSSEKSTAPITRIGYAQHANSAQLHSSLEMLYQIGMVLSEEFKGRKTIRLTQKGIDFYQELVAEGILNSAKINQQYKNVHAKYRSRIEILRDVMDALSRHGGEGAPVWKVLQEANLNGTEQKARTIKSLVDARLIEAKGTWIRFTPLGLEFKGVFVKKIEDLNQTITKFGVVL